MNMCQVVRGLGNGDVLYHAFITKVSVNNVHHAGREAYGLVVMAKVGFRHSTWTSWLCLCSLGK